MSTKLDLRQSVLRSALSMVGSSANANADTLFPLIDAELAKLFEDRNVLLTDGGIITYTGTDIQFTENLNLLINSKVAGGAPVTINLGSTTRVLANGESWYVVINRLLGTAVTTIATNLPAVTSANQEVFLIAKRVDAGDGTQRVYWRNGMALNAGQSVRLGASGSGSGGSGVGDDLNALLFRASFTDNFDEGTTDSKSAVNATAGFTDPTAYSAAKGLFKLNYDASKTTATGTNTTNIVMSSAPSFTVKNGDIVVVNSQARRITNTISQTNYTIEALDVAPVDGTQITVSQAVYSKDIYNLPVDGSALSAEFGAETFSEILVDYEDTTTVDDDIFDVNVAPVIAYDASVDNITFTDVKVRPTLGTTQMESIFLPAAGTALYLRFYANKTSGSGSVNVLKYKTYLQKSAAVASGGVLNQAYAFTNGVGTPVNCIVGLMGGKTTITLTSWTYAVGVNPGLPYGSLDLFINGQLVPRFINATLTPDGSYTEVSSNVIQLDKDYSAVNISVEVLQRISIVDVSTTNTTAIAQLREVQQKGFQSFVDTSTLMNATTTTGSPAAGTFYSSIISRAAITNLTSDLKAGFGINRIVTQQITPLQNEFGPNGELVFGAINDTYGQVRFVGSGWNSLVDTAGFRPQTSVQNDYVEIIFYGTGLNLLGYPEATFNPDLRVSVDGGAEGANLFTGISSIIAGRSYNTNTVFPVVSGLTLGVHTVKIRKNAATAGAFAVNGFEAIITPASTLLTINPGSAYIGGIKSTLSSQQTPSAISSFESGTLGTRGGRVITYLKTDNTIGKAVTPTNASSATLTSTDHTNEDIARVFHWREFGTGRSDDFSTLTSSTGNRAFTLDDDTTTLVGLNVRTNTVTSEGLEPTNGSGNAIVLTFIGTGLDVEITTDANTRQYDAVSIDGSASIGVISKTANTPRETRKIVSGLPYGTHTIRFSMIGSAVDAPAIHKFIVYQPKKPTIPTGAVEIADYNIMANYVANATAGLDFIGTGTLRKHGSRELTYAGTYSATLDVTTTIGGWSFGSTTNSDTIKYTFFGTGFELRAAAGTSLTYTINVDGSTNLSGFTTSTYGTNMSLVANTGTVTQSGAGQNGQGVTVNGLTLGVHTVILTKTAGTSALAAVAFDIVTPIHSHKSNLNYDQQNTMTIGSQAVGDSRAITPIKDDYLQRKNISQAVGVVSNPTTTSTSPVPMPDMSVVHYNKTGKIKISYAAQVSNNTASATIAGLPVIDGVRVDLSGISSSKLYQSFTGSGAGLITDSFIVNIAPGFHKIDLFWYVGSGTGTANGVNRNITVEEV